jgi:hypothetical protein
MKSKIIKNCTIYRFRTKRWLLVSRHFLRILLQRMRKYMKNFPGNRLFRSGSDLVLSEHKSDILSLCHPASLGICVPATRLTARPWEVLIALASYYVWLPSTRSFIDFQCRLRTSEEHDPFMRVCAWQETTSDENGSCFLLPLDRTADNDLEMEQEVDVKLRLRSVIPRPVSNKYRETVLQLHPTVYARI